LDFLGQQTGAGGLSDVFGLSQSPTYVPPQEVCMSANSLLVHVLNILVNCGSLTSSIDS